MTVHEFHSKKVQGVLVKYLRSRNATIERALPEDWRHYTYDAEMVLDLVGELQTQIDNLIRLRNSLTRELWARDALNAELMAQIERGAVVKHAPKESTND